MADISSIQATEATRIVGSDSTGQEQTPVQSTVNGGLHINLRNDSGTEMGTAANPLIVTDTSDGSVIGGTSGTTSQLVGGHYNLTLPTLTTGQQAAIQIDSRGRLLVSSAPLPTTASKFTFADVTTAVIASAPVQRTVYTEQLINTQMSIASSSANDSSAGTGARTVEITYLTSTGVGPLTTTIILNGLTFVNASVSNICFIEKIKVLTVGSTGSNVGILTLKASPAGAGATVGTIAATDNITYWSHHYVPTGKTCYISGFSINSNGTVAGSGAVFVLRASTPMTPNTPELQISDFHRLYGQQSSTNTRNYLSPIQVPGPARIRVYVTPETSTSTVYRAAYDFIDN